MTPLTALPIPESETEILAELEALRRERARRTNLDFTVYTKPDYEVSWHHRVVADALDGVLSGRVRRLIILEPPQNGKSEQVSRRFPAFALGKNPDLRIGGISYNDSLAQDMSRDVQKIMDGAEYRELFPGTRLAEASDPEKRTHSRFDVVERKGYYLSAGVGGSVTGKTLDVGIIDDPIKNRDEAESESYRERVWDFFKSTFVTRQFGMSCAIIICLTHWHEDDLVGRLRALAASNPEADQWDVLSLPAVYDGDANDYDPRKAGEPLWPSKYSAVWLKKQRATIGEYDWAALYQQKPAPSGGGLFKEDWFASKFLDAAPALMRVVRGWDTAGTEQGGDWTAGVKIGEEFSVDERTGETTSTGRFVVLDVQRKQLGPAGVDALIRVTAELDGKECPVREEREGGSAGPAVIAARLKILKGFDYAEMPITGKSKIVRSKPFRAQCEGGNVYLLRAPWNADYVKELCGFPTGKHDDQVDGSSCAFNAVLLEPTPNKADYWVVV